MTRFEKPLAITAEEAASVVSLEKLASASLAVGYTRRFGYGIEFIRRALMENVVGTITGFSVEDELKEFRTLAGG